MKFVFWTNIPNHYQGEFIAALRAYGHDVCVRYYQRMPEFRRKLGWSFNISKCVDDEYVSDPADAIDSICDHQARIHIIPGCMSPFLLKLLSVIIKRRLMWVHWNERAHPGVRWLINYPLKHWYASKINKNSLGAFGIGDKAVSDLIKWGVFSSKVEMLPYSSIFAKAPVEKDKKTSRFVGEDKAFIYSGILCQRKGVDVLIKAFSNLKTRNWKLVLMGNDTSNGYYLRLAKNRNIEGRVLFRGRVTPDRLFSVYSCCNVAILPSRYDGWGMVLQEAASLKMPLIATDAVGAAEHLINGNGFVVKAGSTDELEKAMTEYVEKPGMIKQHGEISFRYANKYSAENNVKKFTNSIKRFNSRKRVLLLRTAADVIDIEKYNCQEVGLSRQLIAGGYDSAICMAGYKASVHILKKNVASQKQPEIFLLPVMRLPFNKGILLGVFKKIDEYQPDIIQLYEYTQIMNIVYALYARYRGINTVLYQGPYTDSPGIVRFAVRFFYDKCINPLLRNGFDAYIAKTRLAQEYLRSKGFKNVSVCPIGLDVEMLAIKGSTRRKFPIGGKRIRMIYVGRLIEDKNVSFIVDVLNALRQKGFKGSLKIVGDGPEKNMIIEHVRKLRLEREVRFVGSVKQSELSKHYRESDVLVLPSNQEIYGMVMLEAGVFSLPTIATATAGAEQLICNNNNGCILNNINVNEWSEKIIEMMEPENWHRLSSNAYGNVKKNYLWKETVKSFESQYAKLIARY